MSDVQLNYYGDPMEMMSWRLVDRLHKLLNQQITVYVGGTARTGIVELTGTLVTVSSDYIELHATRDSQTRTVLIPTTSILFVAVGGPLGISISSGTQPIGSAITTGVK